MKVKFYGVRGSYPVPGKSTIEFGGNTTCVSITKEVEGKFFRIIIDSGSGIIQLGRDIIANYFAKKESLSIPILFTHLHPDHTNGFPFFAPNFFKDAKLCLFGMNTLKKNIETVLTEQMAPPSFPIEYAHLKSYREHFVVEDGLVDMTSLFYLWGKTTNTPIGCFTIKAMQAYAPSHPQQGAIYYRITDDETGKSVVCIWDNESKVGGDQAVINFARGADVMIHDTQYTDEEYKSNKMIVQGFGHSTYEMAVDNAVQAGVPKLYCTHFNPTHNDEKLASIQKYYVEGFPFDPAAPGSKILNGNKVAVILAKEGMEFEV
jgi:ribonuclease BN (tRNA processing enzyme)